MLFVTRPKGMLEKRCDEEMQREITLIKKSTKIIIKAALKIVLGYGKYFWAMQKACQW